MPSDRADAPTKDLVPPEAGGDDGAPRRVTPLKVLLAVVLLGIVAMWAYAFSPLAERPAPDALRDTSVGTRGEVICKPVVEQLDRLPKPNQTPEQNRRADVVDQSNALLAGMVDQLAPLSIGGAPDDQARDRKIYDEWITDWRTYIGNRQDYARRLRADKDARIFVSLKGTKQITEPLGGFAQANAMTSCKPPGDIF